MSENVANLLLIGGANSDGAPDPTGASSAPAAVAQRHQHQRDDERRPGAPHREGRTEHHSHHHFTAFSCLF